MNFIKNSESNILIFSRHPNLAFIVDATIHKQKGNWDKAQISRRNWEKEQDKLRDWKIAEGSSSPEVQWVLVKIYNEKEKAKRLNEEIIEEQPKGRFSVYLRALKIIEKELE